MEDEIGKDIDNLNVKIDLRNCPDFENFNEVADFYKKDPVKDKAFIDAVMDFARELRND